MRKLVLSVASLLFLVFGSMAFTSHWNTVHAEDDEEQEDDRKEDDNDEEEARQDDSQPDSNKSITLKQPTLVPVTTTTQQKITTVLVDSDGDGLYDNEDPHPSIPEIFIVYDDNRNGIADHFEYSP